MSDGSGTPATAKYGFSTHGKRLGRPEGRDAVGTRASVACEPCRKVKKKCKVEAGSQICNTCLKRRWYNRKKCTFPATTRGGTDKGPKESHGSTIPTHEEVVSESGKQTHTGMDGSFDGSLVDWDPRAIEITEDRQIAAGEDSWVGADELGGYSDLSIQQEPCTGACSPRSSTSPFVARAGPWANQTLFFSPPPGPSLDETITTASQSPQAAQAQTYTYGAMFPSEASGFNNHDPDPQWPITENVPMGDFESSEDEGDNE